MRREHQTFPEAIIRRDVMHWAHGAGGRAPSASPNPQECVARQRPARSDGRPRCARGDWEAAPDDLGVRGERSPRRGRIGHRNHEPNLSPEALREGDPLQLSGAELSLKVAQPALDLNEDQLTHAAQDHVGRAAVGRRCDRYLQTDLPGPMSCRPDQLSHAQLPGIPETNPIGRVEPHGQPMADPSSESRHRRQVWSREAPLHSADRRLTSPGAAAELPLR